MRIRTLALALAAVTAFAANPKVAFTTSLGSFKVELNPEAAPRTVENFLGYVRSGHYKGTTFHRVISKFMVQGGGMTPAGVEKPTRKGIQNEAQMAKEKGLVNARGTVAMARTRDPHSATAQFFVNVVDNPFLDFPGQDGWGYCVFGKVIEGMDTIDKIKAVKTLPGDRPETPVIITGAKIEGEAAPAKKGKGPRKK